jgi:TctA family transporter
LSLHPISVAVPGHRVVHLYGVYSTHNNVLDIWVLIEFGLIGYGSVGNGCAA